MPIVNDPCWVRTLSGASLGFRYEPGSALRAIGVVDEYFALSGDWIAMELDAAQIAQIRFVHQLEVTSMDPYVMFEEASDQVSDPPLPNLG